MTISISDIAEAARNGQKERCAQMVDKKAAEIEAWSYQDDASRLAAEMLRKAAAAIRKDQP